MFCRKCGAQIPDDSEFCYKCGAETGQKSERNDSKIYIYTNNVKKMKTAKSLEEIKEIENVFRSLGDFKDSAELLRQCMENEDPLLYDGSVELMKAAEAADSAELYAEAEKSFRSLKGYRDCDKLAEECEYEKKLRIYNDGYRILSDAKSAEEYRTAREKFLETKGFEDADELAEKCTKKINELIYNDAKTKLKFANSNAEFEEAEELFRQLGDYADSAKMVKKCVDEKEKLGYNIIVDQLGKCKCYEDFKKAAEEFRKLGNVLDAPKMVELCEEKAAQLQDLYKCEDMYNDYRKAVTALECSNDINALNSASQKLRDLGDYRDAEQLAQECDQKIFALKRGEKYFGRSHTIAPFNREEEAARIIKEDTINKIVCPNCGAKTDMDNAFCNKCGFKLHETPRDAEDEKSVGFCRFCGKPLKAANLKFCPYCSGELK